MFYLPKVQPSKPKSSTFQAQTLDVLSLKSLTFQAQTLGVLSSKSPTFQAQYLMFYLSRVQRFKLKSLTFQAQKPRFQVLNLAVRPYFVYSFALFSFSFSVLFHPFLSAHRWLVPVHGSVYRGSLDALFHPVRGCYHGSVGLFPD